MKNHQKDNPYLYPKKVETYSLSNAVVLNLEEKASYITYTTFHYKITGLEITAGQRTMSGLIVDLTGQTFVLPVMLTGQN